MSPDKKKILFICTHNSARSQMAEGLINNRYGNIYEAHSAGTKPTAVNAYAIQAMAEIDIDISQHRAKSIEEFKDVSFDYVVTVCDKARETCPFFPGAKEYLHIGFEDPSPANGSATIALATFRRIRNEIEAWIKDTFGKEKQRD